jgi:hypothetical protein
VIVDFETELGLSGSRKLPKAVVMDLFEFRESRKFK